MSVFGGKSMLQRTVERVLPLDPERIIVVTNTLQAEETKRQLACFGNDAIFVVEEPLARNTAPAIGLAAALIERQDPTSIMAVLPADHFIRDEEEFRAALLRAEAAAADWNLVTLGIVPTGPETGYGYIEADPGQGTGEVLPVKRFVEKPPREKAFEFVASGNFFWNSGMFVWRTDVILDRIRTHMPDLWAGLSILDVPAGMGHLHSLKEQVTHLYGRIEAQSIDYGVMEKAEGVVVLPSSFGWSDVGSWSAVPEIMEAGLDGNVVMDDSPLVCLDAGGCLVRGGGRVVALVGVRDLIVVDTGDALLVCSRDRAQDVKKITEELKERGLTELL
jgi:mannose-1-phosphate guanylyltransferase